MAVAVSPGDTMTVVLERDRGRPAGERRTFQARAVSARKAAELGRLWELPVDDPELWRELAGLLIGWSVEKLLDELTVAQAYELLRLIRVGYDMADLEPSGSPSPSSTAGSVPAVGASATG